MTEADASGNAQGRSQVLPRKENNMTTDGEYKVGRDTVYVENGYVKSGIRGEGLYAHPVYPYRWNNKVKTWVRDECVTLSALRSGERRNTIQMI